MPADSFASAHPNKLDADWFATEPFGESMIFPASKLTVVNILDDARYEAMGWTNLDAKNILQLGNHKDVSRGLRARDSRAGFRGQL